MAKTKNPLSRYHILDECFKNPYRRYTIDDLLTAVNQKLFEIYDDESHCIKKRQLQDDIKFMKSAEGWNIEFADIKDAKKKIYQYEDLNFSILNAPLKQVEIDTLQIAIQTLAQFEGMPQFDGVQEIVAKLKTGLKSNDNSKPFIGFDRANDLKGASYFGFLYNAVQNQTPLRITYKDFKSIEPNTFTLHPYYLKEYNNRWFLFGLHDAYQKADWNVAMDRILELQTDSVDFIPNINIDWQEYFSDMIGVTKPENQPIENVVLHFNKLTGKYMETKSIHETQKNKWMDASTLEVKIKVVINYELERLILSYCESVKVIAPESLRLKIQQRLVEATNRYA
jgi:predicted DNA-binding transcriptional regulator YafY